MSAPGAFELVLGSEGPLLLWSPMGTGSHRSSIVTQRMDREGLMRDPPQSWDVSSIAPGSIVEITGAAAAGEIGVAWVTRHEAKWVAFQAHGRDRAVALMTPEALGNVEPTNATRGRALVAAGESGDLQVTWRGERARCEAQNGTCSHYSRRSLSPGTPADRGVITREMLVPCDPLLLGSLWADGSWYEAVCHRDPDPVAYVFSFRPEISYAEVNDLFAGCDAFALARAAVGTSLWARCSDGTAIASRSHRPELNRVLRRVTQTVRCVEGRPVLVARSDGGTLEFALSAPVDGIAPWLPNLPVGSRAVWTGTHVVAAFVDDETLRFKRGACRGADFAWCGESTSP